MFKKQSSETLLIKAQKIKNSIVLLLFKKQSSETLLIKQTSATRTEGNVFFFFGRPLPIRSPRKTSRGTLLHCKYQNIDIDNMTTLQDKTNTTGVSSPGNQIQFSRGGIAKKNIVGSRNVQTPTTRMPQATVIASLSR